MRVKQSWYGFNPFLVLIFVLLMLPYKNNAQEEVKKTLRLEELTEEFKFFGRAFRGGTWAEEGPIIYYTEFNRETNATDIMVYNLEEDETDVYLDGSSLYAEDVDRVINIENYEYNHDKTKLLLYTDSAPVWRFNTQGYYYVYEIETGKLTPISSRDKGYQLFAKFSPDSKYVGFVRGRNLFIVDLETMKETQLTNDGSENAIINGTTDWEYEEEFNIRDGWYWSPDSKYIAFLQFDESAVSEFTLLNLLGYKPETTTFKFPFAGEANSEIRVGIVDLQSKKISYFDTGTWKTASDEFEYIPGLGWTPDINGKSLVWFFRINRDQNDLQLLYGDPATMSFEVIVEEKSGTWVDVENFASQDEKMTFLDDDKHFIWRSDQDGWNHLYLYTNEGELVDQLTYGEWEVTRFYGYDQESGYIYFNATMDSPMERHLYRVPINQKNINVTPERITIDPGTHNISLSKDFEYFIDNYSNINTPRTTTLYDIGGKLIKVLEDNADLKNLIKEYDLPQYEFTTVPAADGTPLNAFMLKPSDFDPSKKYALFITTYGGPGVQTVLDAWDGFFGIFHSYLVQNYDIIVAAVDNRGSTGRGKAFASANYKNLGTLEPQDQISAANYWGRLPYIDETKMGIWGWSYGGYNTIQSMCKYGGPETFKFGIAIAPGGDFRLYDAIYTERYMSLPQKNEEGYNEGDPSNFVKNLGDNQNLLIVHGDMDDNAHFQMTVHIISALQKAKKQFSLMIYPGGNHGLRGTGNRFVFSHLMRMMTNFIEDNIK